MIGFGVSRDRESFQTCSALSRYRPVYCRAQIAISTGAHPLRVAEQVAFQMRDAAQAAKTPLLPVGTNCREVEMHAHDMHAQLPCRRQARAQGTVQEAARAPSGWGGMPPPTQSKHNLPMHISRALHEAVLPPLCSRCTLPMSANVDIQQKAGFSKP